MNYLGYSIYSRLFLGDREMLADLGVKGDEPSVIFPTVLESVQKIVDNFSDRMELGATIHFCGIMYLMENDFMLEPWLSALKQIKMRYPFVLGLHINFDHQNLPLAPGFDETFLKAMKLCTALNVDAMVMHAPLIQTGNTDDDFVAAMTKEKILDAMDENKTVLCWENAQDPEARYRFLDNLIHWREKLVEKLDCIGRDDLVDRHLFCFDTGHFLLSLQRDHANKDQVEKYLPEFGKHVKVYHIQANDGTSDQHLIPFINFKAVNCRKEVNHSRFEENSRKVIDYIQACEDNTDLEGRHLHLEVDNPMPISEMIRFYERYFDR
ncbi:MAG: hypothetical protein ACTSWN_08455 [Promethearchaeota archaeon]